MHVAKIEKNGSQVIVYCPIQKVEALEDRARELTEQLETQYELHKTAAARARKAEDEVADLRSRLQSAEGELAAGDVLREGFKSDKEQVRIQSLHFEWFCNI